MKLIVGLGNPGAEYEQTRHNVGFMVLDVILSQLKASRLKQNHKAALWCARVEGEEVLLAKPLTYMNLSGEAVSRLVKAHNLSVDDLLVIVDDMDLPTGRVRVRAKGSSGGHRGLKSIIEHLGRDDFARIRVGIGRPEYEVVDYVLGRFTRQEWELVEPALDKAASAAVTWILHGIDKAMSTYNIKS